MCARAVGTLSRVITSGSTRTSFERASNLVLSQASQADVETAPRSQLNRRFSAILNDSVITSGPREFDMKTSASAVMRYSERASLREEVRVRITREKREPPLCPPFGSSVSLWEPDTYPGTSGAIADLARVTVRVITRLLGVHFTSVAAHALWRFIDAPFPLDEVSVDRFRVECRSILLVKALNIEVRDRVLSCGCGQGRVRLWGTFPRCC
jgi:hypothetical protein